MSTETHRWTFTVTSITETGMKGVVADLRKRFGRGPLIHDAVHEHGTLRDVIVQSTREAIAAAIVERLHRGAAGRLAPVEVSR